MLSASAPGGGGVLVQAGGREEVVVGLPGLGEMQGSIERPPHDSRASGATPPVARFLRVPFAKAPVGDLRWRSPQAHGPWKGTLNCTAFGPACPGAGGAAAVSSEDCLFLNVFAPLDSVLAAASRGPRPPRLPVLVWMHGGGFASGSPSLGPPARGEELVSASGGSVVLVTVAYRLGVLGFLGGHKSIAGRSTEGAMGNFGIEDQRMALEWVRDFVRFFGGDRQRVTIAGEGSGGASVLQHLVRGDSWSLYSGAVIQGGALYSTVTPSQAKANFLALLRSTGCGGIDCLLRLDEAALLERGDAVSQAESNWWPVAMRAPMELVAKGEYNRMPPVLLGASEDEWASLVLGDRSVYPRAMNAAEQDHALATLLGDAGLELALQDRADDARWNSSGTGSGCSHEWWKSLRTLSDWLVGVCPHRHAAAALSEGGTPSVYFYQFTQPPPGSGDGLVPHGSELPYLFGLGSGEVLREEAEAQLAWRVREYWLNFVRTGDPNEAGLPHWPPFSSSEGAARLAAGPGGVRAVASSGACDFWEAWRAEQSGLGGGHSIAGGLADRQLLLLETGPLRGWSGGSLRAEPTLAPAALRARLGVGSAQQPGTSADHWLPVAALLSLVVVGTALLASACRAWPTGDEAQAPRSRSRSSSPGRSLELGASRAGKSPDRNDDREASAPGVRYQLLPPGSPGLVPGPERGRPTSAPGTRYQLLQGAAPVANRG
ncbi:unnamed protein product [Prorocentrum cordatum]|uniref:Carboxylesterase type B domain-containing protein n=1 Tax=Prorocentrum cordatum TaxID=2364126 RepID=A0ABN9SH77_9DINO|nr:unnamed protein product [Polarella glacialis]